MPDSFSSISFRLAYPSDALALTRMNALLIEDEGHRNTMTLSELQRRMGNWLRHEFQATLFSRDARIVGYALYRFEPDWVYLRQFFVDRGHRRIKIGSLALDWLWKNPWQDTKRVRLDVLMGNQEGIDFWRSQGFADYCVTMQREISSDGG